MRQPIAIATLLVLAACGGRDDESGEKGTETSAAAGGGGVTMQPGEWEMTTEVVRINASNLPQGMAPPSIPPTTIRTCLTPEDAERMNAQIVTGGDMPEGCSYDNLRMAGGRIEGAIQCETPGGSMRATVDGRFTSTSYEMTQQIETVGQGATMQMDGRVTGRRIGDCPTG